MSPTSSTSFYADFQGLAALKNSAAAQDPAALREAARQFESIFTQMMMKSMRSASLGESLLDNEQSKFYLDMFDNQMAVQLSKGRGLGLADMLVKQLQGLVANPNDAIVKPSQVLESDHSLKPLAIENVRALPLPVAEKTEFTLPKAPTAASTVQEANPNREARGVQPLQQGSKSISEQPRAFRAEPLASSPEDFVARMWPHAEAAGRELGVDPRTLIAHAALETGWGKSVPCNPDGSCSFNLFGIKSTPAWKGERIGVNTLEFENGVASRRRESFRAYASPADSFKDYAALLKGNPRYASALGAADDATKFASALQQGGYATDPNYARKLAATSASVVTRTAALVKDALLKTGDMRPLSVIGGVASEAVGNVVNRVAAGLVASGVVSGQADRIGGER